MRIFITDCHHTPKDLIKDCFSQPPPPLVNGFLSILSFCYKCFPFVLKRNSILITLGITSVDGLKIDLGLVRLGEYTVCIFGDEVLPYRPPFAP